MGGVPRRRPVRRLALALIGGIALVVLLPSPAAADPAGPTDFRSEVTGIEPAVEGVRAEIRGGDAFLELQVERGHEATVQGYGDEPYLRFREDGTVERNRNSPATYINDDRMGAGTVPEGAGADAEPVWEQVATGGTYAWHDHRVHWMSGASPPVERGERVTGQYDPWRVPIEVDGTAAEVRGTLTYASATSPAPWIALMVVAAGALGWLGRRRAVVAAAGSLALGSALAAVVGRSEFSESPGANPLLWWLPAAALVGALVALAPRARGLAVVGTLASVACLSGWVLLRFDVLTKPILPTSLPFWFDRATTALGLGLSVAAAYLAVTSGQLRLAPLPDDEGVSSSLPSGEARTKASDLGSP